MSLLLSAFLLTPDFPAWGHCDMRDSLGTRLPSYTTVVVDQVYAETTLNSTIPVLENEAYGLHKRTLAEGCQCMNV